jgi:hypothetical protein
VSAAISYEDLPSWMRPRRRLPDLGALLALVLAALIALPLFTRSGIPPYSALPLHALRAAESANLLRQGVFYPRWASGFHFTYGAPVLNYLPPLPHMLAALHQIITEATPLQSVKVLMLAAWAMAGLGMYAFGRGRFGVRGGILAAFSYLMSVPLAFAVPYQLGELPYQLALALLPCAAAAIDLFWRTGGRRAFALALGLCLAFCLCDSRLTFFGGVALGFVALSGRLYAPAQVRWQRALYIIALIALTALLSAFYWLPAVAEREAVRWLSAGAPSYAEPIPIAESLLSAPYYDLSAQNPPVLRGVGIGVFGLACLALLIAGQQRWQVGVFFGLGIALIALSTPHFERLWQARETFLPLLPYHAVLTATFCLAVASGGAGLGAAQGLRAAVQLGALALLPGLPMLGAFFPPTWIASDSESALVALEGELAGYHAASLREGILLPSSVGTLPRPLPSVVENLRQGRAIDRVNRTTLGGGQIAPISEGGLTWRYIVNTLENSRVEFFFHNGIAWRARLYDELLPISTSPDGFLQVSLPAANAELTLSIDETPVGNLAWLLSSFGALSALLICLRLPSVPLGLGDTTLRLERAERIALGAALLLLLGAASLVRWQPDLILPRSQRGAVFGPMTPLPRFSQAGIDLLGYHLPRSTLQRGETLALTLYWQAARPLLEYKQSEARLIDVSTGAIVARSSQRHVGGMPTLQWRLIGYVRDDLRLSLPPTLPSGSYLLKVGLGVCNAPSPLPCESLRFLDAYDAQGRPERDGIVVPQIIRVQ